MASPPSIEFRGVSKSYPLYDAPSARLKELATFNHKKFHRDFWALRDLDITVRQGETFCVIGENGSGKSTLLQLAAGILQPTTGEVIIHGRVAALLELGSGFNPEFSGRDNVYLNGAILGLSTEEMDRRYSAIEDFAEIGDFIHRPVKTYSSGMIVRLGFSVAIHVDPQILLVDEALAVGDLYFRQRCMRKVHELRKRGITILFVSHSTGDVKALGDRTLWLDQGRVRELGDTGAVVTKYLAAMLEKDADYAQHGVERQQPGATVAAPEIADRLPNVDHRFGDGRGEVIGIAILDPAGHPIGLLEPDTTIVVRISVSARQPIARPIVGFMLRNHLGVDFAGSNTARENCPLPPMHAGDVYTVDFHLDLPTLYASQFSFSPAIADGTLEGYQICDWVENAIVLQMGHADGPVYGQLHLPCRVEINARLAKSSSEVQNA